MKVGILTFPYFQKKSLGGDEILFRNIREQLEVQHDVDLLHYTPRYRKWMRKRTPRVKKLAVKIEELLLPILITRWVERRYNEYSLLIVDSATMWRKPVIKGKVICVVNMDYQGYLNSLHGYLKGYQSLVLIVKSYCQNKLIRAIPTVAVSRFLYRQLEPRRPYEIRLIPNQLSIPNLFLKGERACIENDAMLFVGSGDYYGKGIDILEKLSVQGLKIDAVTKYPCKHVRQLEPRSHHELLHLMQSYRLLIFPSRYETFGFVVYEALSLGIPVLMSRVGVGEQVEEFCADFIIDNWSNDVPERMALLLDNYDAYSSTAKAIAKELESSARCDGNWLELLNEFEK